MPYPHRIIEDKPDSVVIEIQAWDNKKHYRLDLPAENYYQWMDGALIQNAFPGLHVDVRELMTSGTSPEDLHGIFQVEK